jgi:hypothetical protein
MRAPRSLPARIPARVRPELTLSGRLGDLRALVTCYGDIPLRVLARDLAGPDAPDYPPAHAPAYHS